MAKTKRIILKQHNQERAKNTKKQNKNKAIILVVEKEINKLEKLTEQTVES